MGPFLAALMAIVTIHYASGSQPTPPSAFTLPSTFNLPAAADPLAAFAGAWTDGRVRLVLVPRPCGRSEQCVFGAIPDGPFEGALQLTPGAPARAELSGVLVRAVAALTREPVSAMLAPEGLHIAIGGRQLRLRRSRHIDAEALVDVSIVAHRGLSLEHSSLDNTAEGIQLARTFGASAIEIDVVVPHEDADGSRRPLTSELRVHHPPVVRAELTGFDSSPLRDVRDALTPRAALALASAHHLPLVYLDAKLRWLQQNEPAMRQVLRDLQAIAREAAQRDPALHVLIGAETNRASELLAEDRWPASQRVGWAQELTRGTDVESALRRAVAAPDRRSAALAVNLLAVRGGGGGVLGWFLRDLDQFEGRISALEQPLIFWTAASQDQFEGALRARMRMRGKRGQRVAIMTPWAHRLAYFLASGESR